LSWIEYKLFGLIILILREEVNNCN